MEKKHNAEKTSVMRVLDAKKIPYEHYCYVETGETNGEKVAQIFGQNHSQVFKTLVTMGKSGAHCVFMIPVCEELDLKKAAKAVGEKSIEMLRAKELLPLTGYEHGGCSPVGMKKLFPTTIHETAKEFAAIFFSAGKIGYQVKVSCEELGKVIPCQYADLV